MNAAGLSGWHKVSRVTGSACCPRIRHPLPLETSCSSTFLPILPPTPQTNNGHYRTFPDTTGHFPVSTGNFLPFQVFRLWSQTGACTSVASLASPFRSPGKMTLVAKPTVEAVFNGSGSITAGTIDLNAATNSPAGVLSQTITGAYKVDNTTHRACLSFSTASGTQHYRASLGNLSGGVASLGHMIGFDPSEPFYRGGSTQAEHRATALR